MKIGTHILESPVILAPMAGVTDLPFRQLCKNMGAGMAVSEMVAATSLLRGSAKTLKRASHDGESLPRSIQIVGTDPYIMAEGAKFNEAKGAQIIDINMGCPAKKVCNVLSGSALLKDEPLVTRILEAVVKAVQIPVTLKIRTGWDATHRNGVKIAQIAEKCGIQALSVHGRTRACYFKGEAEYETIRAIKAAVTIPVIANGDITTPEKAKFVLDVTKADAVMIGRAAQGRPWIFREINHYLKTGDSLPEPTCAEIKEILCGHIENLYSFYGERTGALIARKHVSWYSKGQKNGARFREAFNRAETSTEQRILIQDFFDQLMTSEYEFIT